MKLATWNIDRPRATHKHFATILHDLEQQDADILILTETNAIIGLGDGYHSFHSSPLPSPQYHADERRVSIYSKYNCTRQHDTYNKDTAICCELETPLGPLAVYATIIGVLGNRDSNFQQELDGQLRDIDRIAATANICIAGDFNISFSDNYYYTKEGREKLVTCFQKNKLYNLTHSIPENIDHIVLSKSFVVGRETQQRRKEIKITTWNNPPNKAVSDHKGVGVTIL